ncbi:MULTISPECIES: cupin domain-containing protein [Marinobacter]|uniref:Cupin domain-containing protein n=1 Tax=Marinobacter suaedae TaxID=3057675 RepID=A0ABT8VXY6_9GAMM|nr:MULTISPECIES: cupin domain-containing protein [unclassified Marinobacter]MBZ2168970.1 cupin domain-containing protein [Marinobacter sp. F4216]MDO3720856.1 cupin domain-containing protein [Marinobacter sp. chi1]
MSLISGIVDVATTGIDAENFLPDAGKILSGKPEQNVWNCFSSGDEKFHVGTWDSQAGEWTVSYSENEFCLILEGESVISDKDGHQKTVKAGDQFVMPAGFEGTWSVPSYCKKIYVVYEA